MKDKDKAKEQLLGELAEMRRRIAQFEAAEVAHVQTEKSPSLLDGSYQRLFEFFPIGITVLDMKGVILYCSSVVYNKGGYTEGEFTGKHFSKITPIRLKDIPKFIRVFNSVVRGRIHKSFEAIYQRKDGTTGWTDLSISLIKVGRKRRILVMQHDITERRKAEEQAIVANERLRYLLSASPAVVYSAKTSGDYGATFISANITQMVGYEPRELTGNSSFWIEHVHPDDVQLIYQEAPRLFEKEQHSYEYRFRRKDGCYIWIRDEMILVRNEEGKPVEIIGYWADITERKQTEEEVIRGRDYLKNLTDSMGDAVFAVRMPERVIEWANDSFRLIGYEPEECIGKTTEFLYPDKEGFLTFGNKLKNAIAEGKDVMHTEQLLRRKNGELFPAEITLTFFREKGEVVRVTSIIRDITERKQAAEIIRRQKDQAAQYLNIAGVLLAAVDADENITMINKRGCGILGYKERELIGKNWFDTLVPQRIRGEIREVFNKLMAGDIELVEYYENSLLTKDGEERLGAFHNTVIRNPNGEITGVLFSAEDITGRKQSEVALRQSEEKLRLMFESVTDGITVTDMNGVIIDLNDTTVQLHGFSSKDELLGKSAFELIDPHDQKKAAAFMQKTLEEGAVMGIGYTLLKADGSKFPGELSASVLRDESDNPVGFIAVTRDITERKKAEEREKQLQQELILSSRLATVGEMASGIAHEINNPLTGVMGFSDLLMKRDLPEDIKEDVNIIHEGAKQIADITDRMLTLAHRRKAERTSVNINEIIEATLAMRAYEMKASNIKVTTQLASDIPLTFADVGQLQQVFLNIILNAEMEMKLAHGRGNLTVKTEKIEKIDNTIRVSFKDDGPGISRINLDRVFDPFFTTRDPDKGTGLGLSICYRIVTQHGGKIYARSRLRKGATFFVELSVVTKEEQLKMAEPAAELPRTLSRARILVVDDDAIVQKFLTTILTEEGHQLEIVENGDDALERVDSGDYDVILLDIKLPGMSGIELYRYMQKTAKSLARRVVFITGDTMSADTMDFLAMAGAPYIAKPFDAEQLKKDINRLLER